MNKSKLFIAILLIFILYINTIGNIVFVIKMNWKVDLPNFDKKIYYKDSGASFNGDGTRYSVLEYYSKRKIDKLNKMNWSSGNIHEYQKNINDLLLVLKIQEEYNIDFEQEHKVYVYQDIDLSTIYMIYVPRENRLYIIEQLL